PSTVASLNNLAMLYEAMDQYEEAKSLYQRVLSVYEQQLELNHPDQVSEDH
ncbi:MAG: tetratricopeptide repeat protein, partial [Leptolyngbya sp. SIO3F4]|nr:tetratricopeptide repeat protein [Leptolyngbya sp. SIO3F4]